MKVIIYGKDGCVNCDKAKMLCQIQSLSFEYHKVGTDIEAEDLNAKVGFNVTNLPQIFIEQGDESQYIGGYDALRVSLQKAS